LFRGFAATTVLAVVASLGLGVWIVAGALIAVDESANGSSASQLSVTTLDKGTNEAEAERAIARAARHHRVNIALIVPDMDGKQGTWNLFVYAGDPSNHSLSERPFDPTITLNIRPATAIGPESVQNRYLTTASGQQLVALQADLRAQGVQSESDEISPFAAAFFVLEDQGRQFVVVVTAVGVILAFSAEALLRRRRQALRRISGWSRREMALREAREAATLTGIVAVTLTVLGSVGLGLYNGFAGLERLVPQVIGTWAVAALLLTVIHVAVATWPRPRHTSQVFAGAAPSALRSAAPAVLHGAVVFLAAASLAAISSSLATSVSLKEALERQAPLAHWDQVSGAAASAFDDTFDDRFAPVVRREMREGRVIFVAHEYSGTPNYNFGPSGDDHLTVNREYLEHVHVSNDHESRVILPPSAPTTADLLIPESLRSERHRIESEYRSWFDFEADATPSDTPALDLRVQLIADGQFTPDLGDEGNPELPARVGNVLLVIPDDAKWIDSSFLSTTVMNGQALFSDPGALRTGVDEAGVRGAIFAFTPFGDTIERQLAELNGEIRRLEAATLMALIVLAFAAWTTVIHHGARRRTERRVLALCGRSRWSTHGRFLTASFALTTVVAAIALTGGARSISESIVAGGLCLLADIAARLCATIVLLREDTRILRQSRTKSRPKEFHG
jgi:hypothetical protein